MEKNRSIHALIAHHIKINSPKKGEYRPDLMTELELGRDAVMENADAAEAVIQLMEKETRLDRKHVYLETLLRCYQELHEMWCQYFPEYVEEAFRE